MTISNIWAANHKAVFAIDYNHTVQQYSVYVVRSAENNTLWFTPLKLANQVWDSAEKAKAAVKAWDKEA